MKKLARFLMPFYFILSALFITTVFTGAYFTDTETSNGNAFTAGMWTPTPTPTPTPTSTPISTPSGLVISEVLYNPSGGSDSGLKWIEIYNNTGSGAVMDGYNLYANGYGYYTFPSFILPSGGLIVVHVNTADTDSATDLYTGSGGSNMSDTAGSIALFNSSTHNSSTIVDYLEYGNGGQTWQPAAVAAGIWTAGDYVVNITIVGNSIALTDKMIDNNKSTDWQEQSSNPGV